MLKVGGSAVLMEVPGVSTCLKVLHYTSRLTCRSCLLVDIVLNKTLLAASLWEQLEVAPEAAAALGSAEH